MKKITKRIVPAVLAAATIGGCSYYDMGEPKLKGMYNSMINRHLERTERLCKDSEEETKSQFAEIPSDFSPWWNENIKENLLGDNDKKAYSLEHLYLLALKNSSQIKVFADLPLLRSTSIMEAEGRFDIHGFIEGKYDKAENPSDSATTFGITDNHHKVTRELEYGIKKKIDTGAEVVLSQNFNQIDENSNQQRYESQQTKSTVVLSVVQPFLRGAGRKYNNSAIRIAKIDSEIARSEFMRQAQSHLMEVTKSYWALYLSRGQLVQKQKLVKDTEDILKKLEQRQNIDTMSNQVLRVKSALASRKAEVVRSELAIKNAEDRIKALVNAPELYEKSSIEIMPIEKPNLEGVTVLMRESVIKALKNRQEIDQAFGQLKALGIRQDMAKNELLPQLNGIAEYRWGGLADDRKNGDANDDQWNHESWMLGFSFEMPFQNRTAKARFARRKIETRQQLSQITTVLDTVVLEVKVNVREVNTAYKDLQAKYQAYVAAEKELKMLKQRWGLARTGGVGGGGVAYLEFLLDSQERLRRTETALLASSVAYNISIVSLERAKGTFLTYNDLEINKVKSDDRKEIPENEEDLDILEIKKIDPKDETEEFEWKELFTRMKDEAVENNAPIIMEEDKVIDVDKMFNEKRETETIMIND